MSALLEGARRLLGRKSDLADQIHGLDQAVEACRGRLDDEVVDPAATIVQRAGTRLRLSPEHTVVALAGATGSGKSSTFNALTGLDLAAVGVRRPTTSWASACIWGDPEGARDLLEWMGIPLRHQTTHDSMLDSGRDGRELKGLVLLDLPDHDSTEVSHHLEVRRLIVLADLMIWVLDPQKYADKAVHEGFFKPMASHKDVMIVVLNHIDEVPRDRRQGMVEDVKRLLTLDGLDGVPVIATSARDGDGIADLEKLITKRVADKKASRSRFRIDVHDAAERLDEACGMATPRDLSNSTRSELNDAVVDAAGVPVVVDAVQRSSRMRAARATGWPPTAWLSKLRPDPLKRLHLDLGAAGRELVPTSTSSVPEATRVQRARVDTAVRARRRRGVRGHVPAVGGRDPQGVGLAGRGLRGRRRPVRGGDPLGAGSVPGWCKAVRVLQWLLIVAALAGAVWLGVLAVMAYLQVPTPDLPTYGGLPLPTALLLGGVAAGVLLAIVSRVLVGMSARSRARAAEKRLRSAIGEVTERMILQPIETELDAYRRAREGLRRALV